MSNISEQISQIEGMRCLGGCTSEQIIDAQVKLGLEFSQEYKEYLLNFGTARFNGVELCGLNSKGYLNVIEATEQEKSIDASFPSRMYVIQNLAIDAKLIIGDAEGNIYLYQRGAMKKICNSFSEYIEKCQYR